ncbi:MltA domain-containing protein [Polaromonas sp.]|uniref:murein transglycosylase A n=1 Tax=Polaromonas sp. TaxID=1869339 RepID=UPI0017AD996D|nr:MltA domain-containing protein [Polaromonas sp.]NML85021.1 transglycosylase [Polaromonas sp.]
MNTSSSNAPSASSKSRVMTFPLIAGKVAMGFRPFFRTAPIIAMTALLVSCASPPLPPSLTSSPSLPPAGTEAALPGRRAGDAGPLPAARLQARSRWVAVRWAELPGFEDDALFEAWNAWIKSCERPGPVFAPLCNEVRRLSIASGEEQRAWMLDRLQPYRVETLQGAAEGLLTSYYEPVLKASRQPGAGYGVPLYRAPALLGSRKPWFSRQEIDTSAEARAALAGREIAWVADPIDALVLHIQGSGRLNISEPDGLQRTVRLAFAGSNDQPYRSVNQWLLEQGVSKINPWPDATKAWALQNPQRLQQLLWSNPRYIFFREEALSDFDARFGPRGAQGVALTPGRSIAVDPGSIPYGTPVWLASRGGAANLQKLVLAQDTGSAIVGGVRADYFAGTGMEAGQMASRVNQPLRLWVLWPK